MKTVILYHGQCFDGFGAAFAAWEKFGDNAVYLPCVYGSPLPEFPKGSQVYMIDYSLPRAEMEELYNYCDGKLVVLDHHKTAEESLKGLPYAIFDMNRSGAMMSWNYFFPNEDAPSLIEYIQDRDLWKNVLPRSEEVNAALASYPMDFWTWVGLSVYNLMEEGKVLLRYRDVLVKMICQKAGYQEIKGHKAYVTNSTSHWSEVGHYLAKNNRFEPFGASFFVDSDGSQKWSLRSIGDLDVSAIAKQYGGGGHRNASGFVLKKGESL